MIENVNNIIDKIKNIQNTPKKLQNIKPKFVKEFENMYKEAKLNNSKNINKEQIKIHPYLDKSNSDTQIDDKIIENDKNLLSRKEKITDAVNKASKKYKISEDLIHAIIKVESNYNPYGISKAGAMGLMQLMPHTVLKTGIEKPFDIYENIDAGTRYMKMMLDRYDHDLEKALAAYNAGPKRVDEYNGIPDIEETINYVDKVKKILFK
jgi:soluble lytic murein transglycosylase-like protein